MREEEEKEKSKRRFVTKEKKRGKNFSEAETAVHQNLKTKNKIKHREIIHQRQRRSV